MIVKLDLINLKISYFQCFDLIKGCNKAETAHWRSNEAEIWAELCSKSHKLTLENYIIPLSHQRALLTELINTLSCTGQNWGVYGSLGQWRTDAIMFSAEMMAIQLKPQMQAIPQVSLKLSSAVSARDPVLISIMLCGSFTVLKPNVVKSSGLH